MGEWEQSSYHGVKGKAFLLMVDGKKGSGERRKEGKRVKNKVYKKEMILI